MNADHRRGQIGQALFREEGSGMKLFTIASVFKFDSKSCGLRSSMAEERS